MDRTSWKSCGTGESGARPWIHSLASLKMCLWPLSGIGWLDEETVLIAKRESVWTGKNSVGHEKKEFDHERTSLVVDGMVGAERAGHRPRRYSPLLFLVFGSYKSLRDEKDFVESQAHATLSATEVGGGRPLWGYKRLLLRLGWVFGSLTTVWTSVGIAGTQINNQGIGTGGVE